MFLTSLWTAPLWNSSACSYHACASRILKLLRAPVISEVVPVLHKEHTISLLQFVAVLSFSFHTSFLLVLLLHSGLAETVLTLLIRGHFLFFFFASQSHFLYKAPLLAYQTCNHLVMRTHWVNMSSKPHVSWNDMQFECGITVNALKVEKGWKQRLQHCRWQCICHCLDIWKKDWFKYNKEKKKPLNKEKKSTWAMR